MARRKNVERERVSPALASEAGLRCQFYRHGTRDTYGNPATCFRPGLGDLCDDHPQAQGAVRYATERVVGYSSVEGQ
jgi:hypothetical protein